MNTLKQKCQNLTGNSWVIVCNDLMFSESQTALADYLRSFKTAGTYLYSKAAGKKVSIAGGEGVAVGETYLEYNMGGNKITFMPDYALTREYPNQQYGIILDLSADLVTGKPAMASFTLEGQEIIQSKYAGHGGMDGKSSGIVSSPVAGSRLIVSGYAGAAFFSPFRSHVMIQSV